jgi:hypothetical protein
VDAGGDGRLAGARCRRVTSPAAPAAMVDFNTILRWVNAGLVVATIAAYMVMGANADVDADTVVLATILGVQTHLALVVEARRRDPFVVLTAFLLVVYFSTRILTLILVPWSFVLDRFPYSAADTDFALLFMVVANLFLYAGFYVVRGGDRLRVKSEGWQPRAPNRALILVVATIIFIYGKGALGLDRLPRAIQVGFVFASQSIVLLLALTFYLLFRDRLSRTYAAVLIGLLVVEMLLHSLAGSRSAFVYSFQNVVMALLAVYGVMVVSRRLVVYSVIALPLVAVFLVISFVVSTYVRAFNAGASVSLSSAISLVRSAQENVGREDVVQTGLPLLLSRVGYFDYSAELIAHRREYAPVITLPAYARSVVDNLLSPGFDVFDQPRISNSLRFVYAETGKPSRVASAEAYQSDQLNLYGELYILFAYASLPVFFVIAFLFKKAYLAARDADPYMVAAKRVVILMVFLLLFNSFGLDWLLTDIVPLAVSIYLYRYFFRSLRVSAPQPAAS